MPASRDAATEASAALAEVFASERLRIVAALIRHTGDWDLAEDSFHDAVTRALTTWPERGIPDNPGAWLTTVARNAATDAIRKATTERRATDLNRVIAVALSDGPDAGLALLDALDLDAPLGEYHLLHATRADLWRRRGRDAEALPHYRRALELAPTAAERRFLQRRIDEIKERTEQG